MNHRLCVTLAVDCAQGEITKLSGEEKREPPFPPGMSCRRVSSSCQAKPVAMVVTLLLIRSTWQRHGDDVVQAAAAHLEDDDQRIVASSIPDPFLEMGRVLLAPATAVDVNGCIHFERMLQGPVLDASGSGRLQGGPWTATTTPAALLVSASSLISPHRGFQRFGQGRRRQRLRARMASETQNALNVLDTTDATRRGPLSSSNVQPIVLGVSTACFHCLPQPMQPAALWVNVTSSVAPNGSTTDGGPSMELWWFVDVDAQFPFLVQLPCIFVERPTSSSIRDHAEAPSPAAAWTHLIEGQTVASFGHHQSSDKDVDDAGAQHHSSAEGPFNVTYTHHYGNLGIYQLDVAVSSHAVNGTFSELLVALNVRILRPASPPWLPLLVAAIILVSVTTLGRIAWNRVATRMARTTAPSAPARVTVVASPPTRSNGVGQRAPASPPSSRVTSIDAFRGFCLCFMIFANYNGGYYWYFNHSYWNGITVADLVFPWFVFLMGATATVTGAFKDKAATVVDSTVVMMVAGQAAAGPESEGIGRMCLFGARISKRFWIVLPFLRTSFIRSCKLFLCGLFLATDNDPYANELNGGTDFPTLRIPGVLQRFAVSYLVVVAVGLFFPVRVHPDVHAVESDPDRPPIDSWRHFFKGFLTVHAPCGSAISYLTRDIGELWWPWVIFSLLHALWYLVSFCVPWPAGPSGAPLCPTGYLGPGGIGDYGMYPNCTGGIATLIDAQVFGTAHLYPNGTYNPLYETSVVHDPEGLLGYTISAFICFMGCVAGRIIQRERLRQSKCADFYGKLALARREARRRRVYENVRATLVNVNATADEQRLSHFGEEEDEPRQHSSPSPPPLDEGLGKNYYDDKGAESAASVDGSTDDD